MHAQKIPSTHKARKSAMENIIIAIILIAIVVGIVLYLIRAKKRGAKCIGCPYANQCGGKCGESVKKDD